MLQDIRFGLRLLWKDRGFAATAILTLALCIGANAAIFAVVNSVLLQPLPVPHAEQLVHMYNAYPGAGVVGGLDRRPRLLRPAARDRRLPGTGALQHARRDARRQRRAAAHHVDAGDALAAAAAPGAAGPRPHLHRGRGRSRQDEQGGPDLRVVAAVVRRPGPRRRQRRPHQRRAVHRRRRAAAGTSASSIRTSRSGCRSRSRPSRSPTTQRHSNNWSYVGAAEGRARRSNRPASRSTR